MPKSEKERPVLIIQDENRPAEQIPILTDDVILGRDDDCDISLNERQISRQHIRIFKEADIYYLEDLDSKNGTWLNGQQIKGVRELHDGDEINVALAVRIRFIGSGATTPIPTANVPMISNVRLRLEREARRVYVNDRELDPSLSLPQYRLLELLFNNIGHICTRDEVVDSVWPEAQGEGVSEQAIDALVRRLRDRLAEVDPDWQYIVTVRGHGFRLDNPPY